jgi:hypothetical protein
LERCFSGTRGVSCDSACNSYRKDRRPYACMCRQTPHTHLRARAREPALIGFHPSSPHCFPFSVSASVCYFRPVLCALILRRPCCGAHGSQHTHARTHSVRNPNIAAVRTQLRNCRVVMYDSEPYAVVSTILSVTHARTRTNTHTHIFDFHFPYSLRRAHPFIHVVTVLLAHGEQHTHSF